MSQKRKWLCRIGAILILLAAAVSLHILRNRPVTFLKDISPSDVAYIEVLHGDSGLHFQIESNREKIERIVTNIQGIQLRRDKQSTGYMGFGFCLTFVGYDGAVIDELIINTERILRKDPYFYVDETGSLCFEFLKHCKTTHMLD